MTIDPSFSDILRRRDARNRRINNDTYAAFALAAATVVTLIWANIGSSYATVWSSDAGIHLGGWNLSMSLADWVSEGLMTVFFFSVGLDVKRELAIGQLRQPERALLPVGCAIGGLVVPAAIFLMITHGQPAANAWGTVISTDTAFAVGMLALVGPRNAPRLKVFLLTLAVVDDIGALAVIAFFYTERIDFVALAIAAAGLVLVWLMQRRDVWRATPYLVLGLLIWVAVLFSGVHATLAGVLLALLIPVYPQRRQDVKLAAQIFHLFGQAPVPRVARAVRRSVDHAVPLNQRLSALLPPYVNYLVVPVFAVASMGIPLSGQLISESVGSRLTWGIIAGLVVGKMIGITTAAGLIEKLVPSTRVPDLDLPRIAGIGALSGMGFTISLLVAGLALDNPIEHDEARVGVLVASVSALLIAWVIFRAGDRWRPLPTPASATLQRAVDPIRDHIRGPRTASATIVVYTAIDSDYKFRTAQALGEVRDRVGDDLRVVFRHHTTTEESLTCALALEAAADQGCFWEMHDALVALLGDPTEADLVDIAERIDLDRERFEQTLTRREQASLVEDDNLDANAAGLPSTPTLYVQGARFGGPANSWQLIETLRRERAAKNRRH